MKSLWRVSSMAHLGSGTGEIRAEHDNPWCVIREFLSASLEAIFEEFEVTAAAHTTFLILDLILNDQSLCLKVNWRRKRSRDCMVSCFVLCYQAFSALDDGCYWFLDCPFTDVAEGFLADRCLFGGF